MVEYNPDKDTIVVSYEAMTARDLDCFTRIFRPHKGKIDCFVDKALDSTFGEMEALGSIVRSTMNHSQNPTLDRDQTIDQLIAERESEITNIAGEKL